MSGGTMGAVGDTRKILQGFLAPELREIKVRLDLLETRVDGVDHKIDRLAEKVDLLDRRSEQRQEAVMALGRLVDYTEVRERLARLEGQQRRNSPWNPAYTTKNSPTKASPK